MDRTVLSFATEPLHAACRVAVQRRDRIKLTAALCFASKDNFVDAASTMAEVFHDLEQLFCRWDQVGTQQRIGAAIATISLDQKAWRLNRDGYVAPWLIRVYQVPSNSLRFLAPKFSEQHSQEISRTPEVPLRDGYIVTRSKCRPSY
ncbi:hypothetical protein [Ralstonia sp. SET104]|uniref:hypothetical protein n=1 Tax=Ralstonia sp. SET104 TaxID=2448774 RepID=UPI000F5663E8|nr:hypothetical protein [Ralstonia sp. SET104]GCB06545.1 hypothetical protein PSUB009319_41760 [Ralstonia sp. SET104]